MKFFPNYKKINEPISFFKKDNFHIKLYPYIDGLSIKESLNNTETDLKCDYFILTIFENNILKYYTQKLIPNKNWTTILININSDSFIRIFQNSKEIRNFTNINTDETIKDLYISLTNKDKYHTMFNRAYFLVDDIYAGLFDEKIVVLNESDYIDYKYTDFYSIRACDSQCLSACEKPHTELDNILIYKPREYTLKNEPICSYIKTFIDPILNKKTEYCSKTELIKVNIDYPSVEEFGNKVIQSTHYKISMSLTEAPLSSICIIDKNLASLIYSTFETSRPITRVSDYVETIEFQTDFSGKGISLYKNGNLNWLSRLVAKIDIIDNGYIYTVGDTIFNESKDEWLINHNLDSYNIIAQSFNHEKEMTYPKKQYSVDANNYKILWNDSSASGFALIHKANFVSVFSEIETKPFYFKHYLNSSEPNIMQVLDTEENFERFEPVEFIELTSESKIELLEKFNNVSNILISKNDKFFYIDKPQTESIIKHDLKMLGVLVQVYDLEFTLTNPQEIILIDNNTIKIKFSKPFSGYVGIKAIGDPYWKNGIIEDIIEKDNNGNYLGKFAVGDLENVTFDKNYGDKFIKSDLDKPMQSKIIYWVPIIDFKEEADKYIFEFIIDKFRYNDININEIGLFDKNKKMCFYSCRRCNI